MDPIELTISDGEETYVITARSQAEGGWIAGLFDATSETRASMWGPAFAVVTDGEPFPTAHACLEALFRAVATELFGLRA